MKSICLALLLVSYACSAFAQQWEKKFAPKDHTNSSIYAMLDSIKTDVERSINSPVPELSYQDIFSGKRDSLGSLRGKVVIISLWGVDCAPCIREMPILQRVQTQLTRKGFQLLSISEDDASRQRKFFTEKKIRLDGITAMTRFDDCLYPFTLYFNPSGYLIDRKGVLRQFWIGPKTYEELTSMVRPYL